MTYAKYSPVKTDGLAAKAWRSIAAIATVCCSVAALTICHIGAYAKTYTPAEVPNVQLQDRTRYLSNPDGIISPQAQMQIDSLLSDVRRTSTAEAMMVVIGDMDPADVDAFSTELFNLWGLGKSDNNNGVLILVAKDARRGVIRTGYGVEGVMPDILCGRIIRRSFELFKEGDFDGGCVLAARNVHTLLTDSVAAAELRSELGVGDADDDEGLLTSLFYLAALIAVVPLLVFFVKLRGVRNLSDREKYDTMVRWRSPLKILSIFTLGIALIGLIPLLSKLKEWRDKPRKCRGCGTMMHKVDEEHDNDYLSAGQDREERLKSVDYDVWLCPKCGETEIIAYKNPQTLYKECEVCHFTTAKLMSERIVKQPTTTAVGRGLRQYKCSHCGKVSYVEYEIPKVADAAAVGAAVGAAALGRGFSGGGGGGSIGGGFGGGMTGGGGASGGW
ncbi:MAG: TPM domain-containing protein [Muribaculaceae bacterium]